MVRFYIELPLGTVPRNVTLEDIQAAARKIFSQYSINFADTFWWSAYSIGQRLADHFSKENRVFLTGDACHTHSPKAGQGMNLSLQDGYNIGWKLASVLKGTAGPELLKTYNIEREKTASDLIAFDREITQMLSSKQTKSAAETAVAYSDHFIKSARYMAGLTTTYADTMITDAKASTQTLAKNITVGMRFPSVQVVRFFDVRAVQLSRALQSDGRWRLMVFSGNVLNQANLARLDRLAEFLTSPKSPIVAFTKKGASSDSLIEPLLVMYGERVKIEDDGIPIPAVFTPVNGKWQMKGQSRLMKFLGKTTDHSLDLNKIYVDDESYNNGHGKAYEKLGIDPEKGAVVVIRPDQHVSLVVSLEDHEIIDRFITGALKSSISNGV
jgi:phenol 2-monooxygenase